MNTMSRLSESCSPYWGLHRYLSTPNYWCLGPEVDIFSPAFMALLSSPSLSTQEPFALDLLDLKLSK